MSSMTMNKIYYDHLCSSLWTIMNTVDLTHRCIWKVENHNCDQKKPSPSVNNIRTIYIVHWIQGFPTWDQPFSFFFIIWKHVKVSVQFSFEFDVFLFDLICLLSCYVCENTPARNPLSQPRFQTRESLPLEHIFSITFY